MALIEASLKQITPMLHFQSKEHGATLRPSEVKPKLDRYILHLLEKSGFQYGNSRDETKSAPDTIPSSWYHVDTAGRRSLRYTMRITAPSEKQDFDKIGDAHKKWKDFIARAGRKLPETVFYIGDITLRVVTKEPLKLERIADNKYDLSEKKKLEHDEKKKNECPVCIAKDEKGAETSCSHTLEETIIKLLPYFFATHTFGSRQSKGYGSFETTKVNEKTTTVNRENMAQLLPPDAILAIAFKTENKNAHFDEIAEELTQSFYAEVGKKSYLEPAKEKQYEYRQKRALLSGPVSSLKRNDAIEKEKYPIFSLEKDKKGPLRRPSVMRFHFDEVGKIHSGKVIFFQIPITQTDKGVIDDEMLKNFNLEAEAMLWAIKFEESKNAEGGTELKKVKFEITQSKDPQQRKPKDTHGSVQSPKGKYDTDNLSLTYTHVKLIAIGNQKEKYERLKKEKEKAQDNNVSSGLVENGIGR